MTDDAPRPLTRHCIVCDWTGTVGALAHIAFIHPDEPGLAVLGQYGEEFVVRLPEPTLDAARVPRSDDALRAALDQHGAATLLHTAKIGCIDNVHNRCDPDGEDLSLWHYDAADRLRAALATPVSPSPGVDPMCAARVSWGICERPRSWHSAAPLSERHDWHAFREEPHA